MLGHDKEQEQGHLPGQMVRPEEGQAFGQGFVTFVPCWPGQTQPLPVSLGEEHIQIPELPEWQLLRGRLLWQNP